jgi:hypothetical protein
MEHLNQVLWWAGDLMLGCILFRAWRGELFAQYPFFYGYVVCVCCSALLRIYLWTVFPEAYRPGYWISEAISAVFGFGVTWEIYAQILAPYRGVGKMARTVIGMVFVLVLAKAMVELWGDPLKHLGPTTAEFEGILRVVQAILLMAILGLIVQYDVPIGRNMRAMLLGYGLYIGCSAVTLSVYSRWGADIGSVLDLVRRFEYTVTLAIWSVGMWSYSRNPAPDNSLECDYNRISEHTMRALGQLRNHLIHSWRP